MTESAKKRNVFKHPMLLNLDDNTFANIQPQTLSI